MKSLLEERFVILLVILDEYVAIEHRVCVCLSVRVYVCVISAVSMWGYSCFRYNILPVRYMNKNTKALRVHSVILL